MQNRFLSLSRLLSERRDGGGRLGNLLLLSGLVNKNICYLQMNIDISSREYYWQDITGGEALAKCVQRLRCVNLLLCVHRWQICKDSPASYVHLQSSTRAFLFNQSYQQLLQMSLACTKGGAESVVRWYITSAVVDWGLDLSSH